MLELQNTQSRNENPHGLDADQRVLSSCHRRFLGLVHCHDNTQKQNQSASGHSAHLK